MKLSVIIPTHNPRLDYLQAVLDALRAQTLPLSRWELLVVDNHSEPPLEGRLDLAWHPQAAILREDRLGLTQARMCGFRNSTGGLVVLVDDDNVLDRDYLEQAAALADAFPNLGTWSGRLTLKYEDPSLAPPPELAQFLTLRELGGDSWSNDPGHNPSTPWGAGLCVRRTVCDAYLRRVAEQPERARLDLQGTTLLYGGDTDIAFAGCAMGLGKGVFARLHITHLIPRRRCELSFLLRSVEGQAYSEILHGYLFTGVARSPRRDWVGRLGEALRWFGMNQAQRQIAAAKRRGYRKALREFAGSKATSH